MHCVIIYIHSLLHPVFPCLILIQWALLALNPPSNDDPSQAHPPVGFPFFGLPPSLLAQISYHQQANQAIDVRFSQLLQLSTLDA